MNTAGHSEATARRGLELTPFRGLRYDPDRVGSLAAVTSPPYDVVVRPDGLHHLAAADPHNIVRLILPRVDSRPEDEDRGNGAAEVAAGMLRSWVAQGVLQRDDRGALWLYELTPSDGEASTVGWLGAVALPPPGSSAVLPHEDTYAPAVEGRRALLAATATDLEPIVLAHDPEPTVAEETRNALHGEPTIELRDYDGVRHRLWRLTDAALLADLTTALGRTGAVIADGHHRFAAAQAYARGSAGRPGSDAILALLTPMGPGGLRVEAIHRVVPDLPLRSAMAAVRRGFGEVTQLPADGPGGAAAAARTWLASAPPGSFVLGAGARLIALSRPSADVAGAVPNEAPPAWRELDVVLAHHGLIEGLWQLPDEPESVVVAHDIATALREAAERGGTALLLRPPSPGDVAAVARSGARMPRKSTLFVPKPRTGLVLRPLDG